jgi:hypothetical protein
MVSDARAEVAVGAALLALVAAGAALAVPAVVVGGLDVVPELAALVVDPLELVGVLSVARAAVPRVGVGVGVGVGVVQVSDDDEMGAGRSIRAADWELRLAPFDAAEEGSGAISSSISSTPTTRTRTICIKWAAFGGASVRHAVLPRVHHIARIVMGLGATVAVTKRHIGRFASVGAKSGQ